MKMLFFELLQIALGNRTEFSHTPTEEGWKDLFLLAQKQAMVGIAFRGIEQLPETQRPPKSLLMKWYIATERIKAMNVDLDHKALAIANKFLDEGFPNMILKGQGVSKLYQIRNNGTPSLNEAEESATTFKSQLSIKDYRTPGDIDIWLSGERKDILKYVRNLVPECKPVYHHVDFPVIKGLEIEVHFTPTWMNSPFTNRRLQQFFCSFPFEVPDSSHSKYSELPVPNLNFNRVFILVHIYRHLFAEGIGLRQMLDYYFVLCQGFTAEERTETMRALHALRMERFAAAVMWVLKEVFGMENQYLLTVPDKQDGQFLLNEIMLAGNFGQYDERLRYMRGESVVSWGWRKIKRNFRFVHCYPSEVLWSPFFKVWHWWWRKRV